MRKMRVGGGGGHPTDFAGRDYLLCAYPTGDVVSTTVSRSSRLSPVCVPGVAMPRRRAGDDARQRLKRRVSKTFTRQTRSTHKFMALPRFSTSRQAAASLVLPARRGACAWAECSVGSALHEHALWVESHPRYSQ